MTLHNQKNTLLFLKKRRLPALVTLLCCLAGVSTFGYSIVNQMSSPEKVSAAVNSSISRNSNPQPNTFKGFGFFPTFPYYNMNNRPGVIKALFEDMKPQVIRIELKSSWSNGSGKVDVNDPQLKQQIQLVKTAASKGITKWIGVHWSPPTEFRKQNSTKAIVNGSENSLRSDKEDDYAKYVAELVKVFVANGAPPPHGISIQNELTFAPSSWDGMKVSQDQFRRLVKLFRKELDAAGFSQNGSSFVRVQGPESGSIAGSKDWMGGSTFSQLKNDSAFANALSDLITHSYHPSKWSGTKYADEWRNGVLNHGGGRDVWMTEMSQISGDKSEMGIAISMAREIGKHMGYIGTNYWMFWVGWHPDTKWKNFPGEAMTAGNVTNELPKRTKLYHVMRLLTNNVKPGSQIYSFKSSDNSLLDVGTDSPDRYVDLLAFKGSGKSVVMMTNNTTSDKNVTVQGLAGMGTNLDIYRVSGGEDGNKIGSAVIDGAGKVTSAIPLKSKSVVILVTNGG